MTRVLGIDFFQGSSSEAITLALSGGLTVAPSGPNLADLDRAPAYQESLKEANLVVLDSGFLVLCWRILRGEKLSRLSGLALLKTLLSNPSYQSLSEQFWIMPSEDSVLKTQEYLGSKGVHLPPSCFYVAPLYPLGEIMDHTALKLLQDQQPRLIMINIAGSKQEVLGAWLMRNLNYRPSIICNGAAIAFLTGEQANIPHWGDRLFLGWLLRIINDPRRYFGRYWQARRLWSLIKTYGANSPSALVNGGGN